MQENLNSIAIALTSYLGIIILLILVLVIAALYDQHQARKLAIKQ